MTAKGTGAPKEKLKDFYEELEQLLSKQLEQQPNLDDVRLKLLELYFDQHRAQDFLRAARTLHRRIAKPALSRDWQRVASMGRMLVPDESLFSGHGSDVVEFVESAPALPKEPPRIQRFGDEPRYRALFDELAQDYAKLRADARFLAQFELQLLSLPSKRPTPLIHAKRLSERIGGAQIYLKREDFAGETPHKLIAVAGQAMVAQQLGRKTLVTATTDGRRGLIAATIGARLGMQVVVYVDAEQAQRFAPAMMFMTLMGASIQRVKASHYRNRDVREAALEHWGGHTEEQFLVVGLDAAPPPYPVMVQDFTAAVGRECRRQLSGPGKRLPDVIVTRGTNAADALGMFPAFLGDARTRLVCVDPEPPPDADVRAMADPFTQVGAPLTSSERKVARNILERLEYPSVAREHALFRASKRVEYVQTSRAAAREALQLLSRLEGIVPAIETAHALAWACEAARSLPRDRTVLMVVAETPDKDAWDIGELVEAATERAAPSPAARPEPARKPPGPRRI